MKKIRDQILSCGNDYKIKLWNTKGENLLTYEGHSEKVTSLIIMNEVNFCTSGHDYVIKGWHVDKIECQFTITGHIGKINDILKINETYKIIFSFIKN